MSWKRELGPLSKKMFYKHQAKTCLSWAIHSHHTVVTGALDANLHAPGSFQAYLWSLSAVSGDGSLKMTVFADRSRSGSWWATARWFSRRWRIRLLHLLVCSFIWLGGSFQIKNIRVYVCTPVTHSITLISLNQTSLVHLMCTWCTLYSSCTSLEEEYTVIFQPPLQSCNISFLHKVAVTIFFSHCHVHLSKKHSFLVFEGGLFYLLELFLTIQVRNNAVACLQAKPRPRRHARQSSTQTGTLRRWELEVWTRNSLTFSVELLHPESFPLTLWSRWVNILAHLSPYF